MATGAGAEDAEQRGGGAGRTAAFGLAAGWLGLLLLTLLLALYGFMLTFTDLGPGETLASRLGLITVFFAMAGYLLGYLAPRRWLLSVLPAFAGFMMLFPAPLTLAAAYLGARRRRRRAERGLEGWDLATGLVFNLAYALIMGYLMLLHRLPLTSIVPAALALGAVNAWLPVWLTRHEDALPSALQRLPLAVRVSLAVALVGLVTAGLLTAASAALDGADLAALAAAVLVAALLNAGLTRVTPARRGKRTGA